MATPEPEHRHIGNGMQASFDGYQIILETHDGYQTTNQIALDNEVIQEKKTSDTTAVTLESNLMPYDCRQHPSGGQIKDSSMQRPDFNHFWRCWIAL